jgi:pyruvate formate lyase activating enzyme
METQQARYEARHYERTGWDGVTCHLCPHHCPIAASRSGTCGVRSNRGGTLYLDTYARVASVDFVYAEDLPLFHFKPALNWVRLGSRGCTMRCPFCNTWRYSQTGGVRSGRLLPEEAVARARESQSGGISLGVAEPAPIFEYAVDLFTAARAAGLETHLATNGYWNEEPLRELLPLTSAWTFGLKSLDPRFHQAQLGADLDAILCAIRLVAASGGHLEISWVVIPGLTDTPEQATRLVNLVNSLEVDPPVILLPFVPDYTWGNKPATTIDQLRLFRQMMADITAEVYIQHPESTHLNTRCIKCGRTLVRRGLARQIITFTPPGATHEICPSCGTPTPFRV